MEVIAYRSVALPSAWSRFQSCARAD